MAIVSMLYGAGGSAEDVSYDNTTSGLEADNVQDAIDELNSNLENESKITQYKGTKSSYGSYPIEIVEKTGNIVYVAIQITLNANISTWKTLYTIPEELRFNVGTQRYLNALILNSSYDFIKSTYVQFNKDGTIQLPDSASSGNHVRFFGTYITD